MVNGTGTLSVQEQDRFNELMAMSYRKVLNLAVRLAGNRSDAEDLTQEAYYRAYRGFHTFDADRQFENWIFRIVTRLFLDLARRKKRRPMTVSYDAPLRADSVDDTVTFEAADPRPNPEAEMLAGVLPENLEHSLNQLTPDQRRLITLADIEQLPYDEISRLIGAPRETVRSRLHRIRKTLRRSLLAQSSELKRTSGRTAAAKGPSN
jgi:RNA polymerase sigma-70 factor (ECF subfamily)